MQLFCYRTGTPQFHFIKQNERFGGLSILVDGKAVKGIRSEKNETVFYQFENGGKLAIKTDPDGNFKFDVIFPWASKLQLDFFLLGKYFNETTGFADEQKFSFPSRNRKEDTYSRIFKGTYKVIRFCEEIQEQNFSVEFEEPQKVSLGGSKNFFLKIMVEKPASGFHFRIIPGKMIEPGHLPPVNRTVKAAGCDLWKLDRYSLPDRSSKNLLQNSSFEQGFRYLMFHHRGRQNFEIFDHKPVTISSKEALFGSHSLAIHSVPDGSLFQPVSSHSVLMGSGPCTVSFYAKSDAPGKQNLTVQMMDPAYVWNKSKWPSLKVTLTGTWKRYSLTHSWKRAAAFPIVFSTDSKVPATCFIDGIQLEQGAKATSYEPPVAEGAFRTSASDNFIEYGKPVDAWLDITSKLGARGSVSVKVRDFFDTVKFQKNFDFQTDEKGKARIDLPLNDLPRGIFIVETDYRIGSKKRYEIQRFSIMSFLKNTHRHKNLFADTYVDPRFPSQIYRDILERYRKLGYGARAGFVNNDQKLAELSDRFGVESIVCRIAHTAKNVKGERDVSIWKNTEWYLIPGMNRKQALLADHLNRKESLSPDFLKQVENAAALVAKSSPSVRGWYFLCEPEGTLPEWANPVFAKQEDFLKFASLECAVAKGIRKGNPKARLYSSTTSNIQSADRMVFYDRLLEETGKQEIRYDGFCAHNYRTGAPEYPVSMETQYSNLFSILKKHGYDDAPVYSPEGMHWLPVRCRKSSFVSDYPVSSAHLNGLLPYTYDLSYAEKIGSAYRARTWLIGLKHQNRIKLMNASNYGTFEMDCMLTPFAFQKIPNTLGRLLGNARFIQELNLFPNTRCYLFEDEEKRPVAVLWACMEEVDLGEVSAPDFFFKPIEGLELFDLMEAEHSLPKGKNGFTRLPLSPYPVFLRGKPGSAERLISALRTGYGKSNIPQRPPLTMRLKSKDSIAAELSNPLNSELRGIMTCRGTQRTIDLEPGKRISMDFDLPVSISSEKQIFFNTVFHLKNSDPQEPGFHYDRSFSALIAKRSKSSIMIDGDPSEWKDVPSISFERLIPGRMLVHNKIIPDRKDFSATYKITWDENGLYLFIDVTDNRHTVIPRPIREGWRNDSLQVFFDAFADARDNDRMRNLGPDDWSYGIYLQDSEGKKVNVFRHLAPDVQLTRGIAGAKAGTVADDVTAAFGKTEKGYFYEIAFSPKSLEPFRLKKGGVIGIGLLLNDVDDMADSGAKEPRSRLTNAVGKEMPNKRPEDWPLILLMD